MMKSIFFGIVALMFAAVLMNQEKASVLADGNALSGTTDKPAELGDWHYVADKCSKALHDQIQKEFEASIFYLQYAAYFEKYDVNLPGFAKFFFNAASEEREHGMKLMEYALMRGQKAINSESFTLNFENNALKLHQFNSTTEDLKKEGTPALQALRAALKKEESVTMSIRELIKQCEETPNDYHLVDYLTGEFLEEQHKGQRELAGKIAMLDKMLKTNHDLGDFIFDKQNM